MLNLLDMTTGNESMLSQNQKALFAAGCFWGVEEIIRKIPGVLYSTVGYTGGKTDSPTYPEVKKGNTGHAEAIEIDFDPQVISYETLLDFFFRLHNPTTMNQQGNDIGSQYRSAIFFYNEEQRILAEAKKAALESSGKWKKPIVTEITKASRFYSAEDYHQDYLIKNPDGYNCHYLHD